MSIEKHYEYYRISESQACELIKQFYDIKKIWLEELKEISELLGANPSAWRWKIGLRGLRLDNFCFPTYTEFDFDHKVIAEEKALIAIKAYKKTTKGRAFADKLKNIIDSFNEKWVGKLSLNDYLVSLFCLSGWKIKYIDRKSHHLKTRFSYDVSKNLIIARVHIKEPPFVLPEYFEKITYGQFYDLHEETNNG